MGFSVLFALLLQPDPAALLPLYREALAAKEKRYGPSHLQAARSASDLGLFLKKLGRNDEARRYLESALEADEGQLGRDHATVCRDVENLASVLPTVAALPLYQRASACPDSAIAARNLARLGNLLQERGELEEAYKAYKLALQAEEKASGPEHANVAVRLNDLALIIEPPAAEPLLHRALAIQRKRLGTEHPETGTTLSNLANVLLAIRRLTEAETAQREALQILESTLGPEHPRVAISCSNLADVLRARRQFAAARKLYERALRIDTKLYGPDHPEVKADHENLAALLEEMR